MITFKAASVVSIGEAMIEIAPVGDGLYRRGFAGDTFNTAWHMKQALLEQARVSFFTCIGEDKLSQEFAASLIADGLEGSSLMTDPSRNMGLYMIELDGVERSFHYWRGQSAARLLADDREKLVAALKPAGLIHLSGITLAILSPPARETVFEVLSIAREAGAIVSFDPNLRPKLWSSSRETRDVFSRMLALTDIALPSFDDEKALWNDANPEATLGRMLKAGVREIVVKDGSKAVHATAEGSSTVTETPAVSKVVDTTGAGDAFNAGYLGARFMSAMQDEAIDSAQRLAALVLQNFGARAPKQDVAGLFRYRQD